MSNITEYELKLINEEYADAHLRQQAIKRVLDGEPLAYIIGHWPFWRGEFNLNRDCLIPRPDTERTVEIAIERIPKNGRFADLCTGSGCIAISVLGDRPDLTAVAVDISEGALGAAAENAGNFGVSERLTFFCEDLLSSDPLEGKFDAIISNPPYIVSNIVDSYPDLAAEPRIALDGGADGLIFYRRFVSEFAHHLTDGGMFIFEIGYDQGDALRSIAKSNGFDAEILRDYGGCDRVALLKRGIR